MWRVITMPMSELPMEHAEKELPMDYETRITELTVGPTGSNKYDLDTTCIAIESDGGVEYVTVNQSTEPISITTDEWPAIRDAIDKLIGECRNG